MTRRPPDPMLIGLDEPACLAPEHTGAKAARLARARAAGLPVLPGFVVPVTAGAAALASGLEVLTADSRHAGQLQVMTAGTPEPLAAELRARAAALGEQVVVRSSSAVEGDLRWAGAFTSFLGVAPEHVPVAVAGCWASALGRDALERCQELGVAPVQLALAVLVQPEIQPTLAGTATIDADGAVRVVSVEGSPAQLMAGWDPAVVTTVPTTPRPASRKPTRGAGSSGPRRRGRDPDRLDETALYAVADLVRAVHAALGDDTIEWALHDGAVVLLQSSAGEPSRQAPPRPAVPNGRRDRRRGLPPSVLPVARLAHRYGGATGDALVLPWALALPGVPEAPAARSGDLPSAWHQAREAAAELTAAAWRAPPDAAAAQAAEALADLRGASAGRAPRRALRRIAELSPVDPRRARRVLALLEAIADGLVRVGQLPAATEFWALAPEQVTALLEGAGGGRPGHAARASGRVAGPWEPFVHTAVITHGRRATGIPAAPGTAAGVAQLIGDDGTVGPTGGRAIWVTERPLPQFAPLLWHAAGLVTAGGSPAAHLVQVARSLHVPAVVGCDLAPLRPDDRADDRPRLVAIDGDTGTVAVTQAAP